MFGLRPVDCLLRGFHYHEVTEIFVRCAYCHILFTPQISNLIMVTDYRYTNESVGKRSGFRLMLALFLIIRLSSTRDDEEEALYPK